MIDVVVGKMVISDDRQQAMYSDQNPMYKLANMVTSESGKVIAQGLSYELRVPFFLGAIKQGHIDLVQWMAETLHWNVDFHLRNALVKLCEDLLCFEPELVDWIRNKFTL